MGIGDRALYRSLRKLRKELAEEQEIPPYLVFPDHTLSAMARQRPQNLKEFRRLSGVGAAKFARYGEVFLAKIREFEETMAS